MPTSIIPIKTTWAAVTKNKFDEVDNVMNMYAKYQLQTPMDFEIFFFENLPIMSPWQPIKFSELNKIHTNHGRLLKKQFCRKIQNDCSETEKITISSIICQRKLSSTASKLLE